MCLAISFLVASFLLIGGRVLVVCIAVLLWQQSVTLWDYKTFFYLLVLMGPYYIYHQLENDAPV